MLGHSALFCNISSTGLWIETETAIVFADPNPIADGHMVVVFRNHVGTIYELTGPDQKRLWELVSEGRSRFVVGLAPDSFSIGFNGTAHEGTGADHAAVSRR